MIHGYLPIATGFSNAIWYEIIYTSESGLQKGFQQFLKASFCTPESFVLFMVNQLGSVERV